MTQAKYTSGGATVSTAVAAAPKSYSSITECVLETMRREGVQGFFRGKRTSHACLLHVCMCVYAYVASCVLHEAFVSLA